MRIGINVSLLSNKLTGVGVYLRDLLQFFSEFDKKNTYFLYSNNPIPNVYTFPTNSIIRINEKRPLLLWQIECLPLMLINDHIDIFWEPNQCMPIMPKGIKCVITIHDLSAYLFPEYASTNSVITNRLFLKKTCTKANKIISISNFTKNEIIDKLHIESNKIEVIYNGDSPYTKETVYDSNEWENIKINLNITSPFFLYVGNIHPRKNISVILDAYELYCQKNSSHIDLIIAGDYSWKTDMICSKIASSSYKNHIKVTGYVNDMTLKYLYKYSKVLLFPSRYEGFGFPIIEAMSVGTPVIVANSSSLPEVAGNAALYLQQLDDYIELESLMEKIIYMSSEQRNVLVETGYYRASLFSRRRCARRMLDVFNEL